jgi:hypothetical protein
LREVKKKKKKKREGIEMVANRTLWASLANTFIFFSKKNQLQNILFFISHQLLLNIFSILVFL